ncbi:YicC family protein [Enhygromyxa salina]|uniref:YicC family protein n=1 Tax=Enhygromyxa salina TaxID=215803 RepID=A0A2S9YMR7_9BACT|nr:DUF1732 domain-containing protein [Enhygromyxa salina]PRQ06383.1 hypothetical protein ENSA7_39290 [Enhygromyxa salina]
MPILSMTGFGVSDRPWTERGVRVHVELRSVNARYLELKLRQPFGVAVEHRLRRAVEAQLGRGRVDVSVRVEGAGELLDDPLAAVGIERQQVASLLRALGSLADEAARVSVQVSPPTSLDLLRFLASSQAASRTGSSAADEAPAFIDELVEEALAKLIEMRRVEGGALAATLAALYDELEAQVAQVEQTVAPEGERLLVELAARCEGLLARVDSSQIGAARIDRERLEQELALLVVRGDVSEELARIASHLEQARTVLGSPPEVGQGKTLDFLSQELLREVTTIGSKITSHGGSGVVINAKRTIERIREQVQNVE